MKNIAIRPWAVALPFSLGRGCLNDTISPPVKRATYTAGAENKQSVANAAPRRERPYVQKGVSP